MSTLEQGKAQPDRETFFEDLAQLLSRGYTLISADISYMMPTYGWSPNTGAGEIMSNYRTPQRLGSHGVRLVVEKWKGANIYRDESLDLEDTDLQQTHKRIETAKQLSVAKWHVPKHESTVEGNSSKVRP